MTASSLLYSQPCGDFTCTCDLSITARVILAHQNHTLSTLRLYSLATKYLRPSHSGISRSVFENNLQLVLFLTASISTASPLIIHNVYICSAALDARLQSPSPHPTLIRTDRP